MKNVNHGLLLSEHPGSGTTAGMLECSTPSPGNDVNYLDHHAVLVAERGQIVLERGQLLLPEPAKRNARETEDQDSR